MIARVTLELALGKEFDYLIPDEMAGLVEIGARVKVPFARRQVLGCVTALLEDSPHPGLRHIVKIIGRQSFVSPKILQLARWMGEYYCCPAEIALKTVLPDAVRKEKEGWREKLSVRALPPQAGEPKLSKRQTQVLELVRQRGELPLQELLALADTTAQTVRRLEDKGFITVEPQIYERDPYERETILPTQSLSFNPDQQRAFDEIIKAMGGTGVPPVDFGVPPKSSPLVRPAAAGSEGIGRDAQSGQAGGLFHPITEPTARRRLLPHFEIPGSTYHVTWKTAGNLQLSEEAREKTLAACQFWHGKKMRCFLACVMPDHVHLLIQPLPIHEPGKSGVHSLTEIVHGIKSFSTHEINKVMKRQGPVWQQESYDRLIRSETDLHEKWDYIWNNPRVTGLAGPLEEYPFMWGGTGVPPVDFGVPPKSSPLVRPAAASEGIGRDAQSGQAGGLFHPITEPTARRRLLPHFEIPGSAYHVTWKTAGNLQLSEEAREKTLAACQFWHGKKMRCFLACVMPDHVHLLIQPLPIHEPGKSGVHSLTEIVHGIKSFSAHEINKVIKRQGPVWQQESYDRLIRSETDLHEKWDYIWNNPRVTGLAGPLEEYPFMWGGTGVPPVHFGVPPKSSPLVRPAAASEGIGRDAQSGQAGGLFHQVFLLHGVTGSGKTEVYLQAIARSLQQGKGAIVLVPEISLTPQTVERFKARFSSGPQKTLVAVLHSHLSAGERHDEWHKIRQGRARIVIGARSAVFAPVDPLGLIIVDEEHEHSYKQEEAPRYHARDVAVVRARMENAVVVLGSATPSMESFYNAQKGKYRLLEMPIRADDKKMPVVRVIDMRQVARHEKATPILSPQLKEAILKRLDRREQTLLFLNRRGFATSLQCPLCGYVAQCPNCSLSLTYHRQAARLRCHICGHEAAAPAVCPEPKCRNPAIRYAGLGTEKVEATLGKLFPQARIRRMDSDTLKRKEDYRRILGDFKTGKIDLLVGTQMIAKGLHFPNVTLVGIIHADLSLHMPDFRAGERTFQLLTQVAGRAGRGDVEGEVLVQAFTPFHPAIQYARRHDYTGFYEQEIDFRRQLNYPPIGRIALLLLKGRNEEKVQFSASHVKREIEKWPALFADLIIAGPAPAPLARAENKYRFHILLRTRHMTRLSQKLAELIAGLNLPEEVTISVDIDPVNLM